MYTFALWIMLVPGGEKLVAKIMIEQPPNYVTRDEALLMDDFPKLRKALAEEAIEQGYMLGYQANLFDNSFGASIRALTIVREAHQRSLTVPFKDYSIRR